MTGTARKISAVILLVLLVAVPFINWKLGAILWMCAWLVFIFQNIFSRNDWRFDKDDDAGEGED